MPAPEILFLHSGKQLLIQRGKRAIVIPNLIRNRKIEVDGLEFCRWKRDFQALATLNQVQGDEKRAVIPNSFRNRKIEVDGLGFCRWKRDFQAFATLNQVQGDKNALRHSELVSESQD